jgi:hypothetical protein
MFTDDVELLSPLSCLKMKSSFYQFCDEAYREGRYYEDLTHLKFNCVSGWPSHLVPEAVLTSLIFFSVVIILAFGLRLVLIIITIC